MPTLPDFLVDDTHALAAVVASLDAACAAPVSDIPERVAAALNLGTSALRLAAAGRPAGSLQGYRRHVLHADPAGRYTLVLLEWGAGQFSPIHAHHTWCGFAVLAGVLQERLYEWDAQAGGARHVATQAREPGPARFSYAGREYIHSLGNPGPGTAYSLHCYAIDGARVGTHVNRFLEAAREAA